ncbi:MAG: hypothetical protein KC410_15115 [Anaerolineales bacterium]|uniref:hypothetical protein n=1 Tax=Promineifilum sp. TaxID=2664178 RepID=UPI001E0B1542|nr:hypothetical protein [Anaerolineales bacterium]MCB8935062.1 hypothetical protein [Promineifilum sp.]MCO5181059.1 hypothetical protein [Promineifilum sp.]
MNSYDAEVHVQRRKEASHRIADGYLVESHLTGSNHHNVGRVHRRLLAEFGRQLITLGYRLQGSMDQLAPSAELSDTLRLSNSKQCVEC